MYFLNCKPNYDIQYFIPIFGLSNWTCKVIEFSFETYVISLKPTAAYYLEIRSSNKNTEKELLHGIITVLMIIAS